MRSSARGGTGSPDPLLTVSEWADRYRVLSQRASSEPGRWRTERTPYLREIMDCLFAGLARAARRPDEGRPDRRDKCGNCWIGYVIHQAAPVASSSSWGSSACVAVHRPTMIRTSRPKWWRSSSDNPMRVLSGLRIDVRQADQRDAPACQTACNLDPRSASNFDPREVVPVVHRRARAGSERAPSALASGRRGRCLCTHRGNRWARAEGSGAVLEAPAFVAGLDDVAVVGEAIEERGGHLGVAEHARPFAEGEVGGDDDGGLLVEAADQVE